MRWSLYREGLHRGVSDTAYHADAALSSTGGRRLLEVVPAQWLYEMENRSTASTDTFDLGKAVHSILLGAGAPLFDLGVNEIRSNDAKTARKEAWDRGEIPLRSKDYDLAYRVADAVFRNPRAAELLAVGEPELSAWALDPLTRMMLRARADWVQWIASDMVVIVDVKKTSTLGPGQFRKSVASFGYYFQQAWYQYVFGLLGIRVAFLFLAIPEDPPHLPFLVELKESAVELGDIQVRRAIDVFAECQTSGIWPDHGDVIHEIDIPSWEYAKENYAS